MHILIRKISPYSGADILLGVFTDKTSAEFTRSLYWELRANAADSDPWYQQSYHPDGLQSQDLVVLQIDGPEFDNEETAFVLSDYLDGLGQLTRRFISLHKNMASAQAAMKQAEATLRDDYAMNYCVIQEVKVGELLSDAKEDQPRR